MKLRKRIAALMASGGLVLGLLGMSAGVTFAGPSGWQDCDGIQVQNHDQDGEGCSSEAPSEAPSEAASEAPTEAPSFEQSEVAETEVASEAPSEAASEAPSEAASEAPSEAASEAPSEEVPSEVPSFEQSQGGETDVPTEPNTATVDGGQTSHPGDGSWLMILALGLLLGSVVVMTPARGKRR